MSGDTRVTVHYGPARWFEDAVVPQPSESFLDAVFAHDEARNNVAVPQEAPRRGRLVAESDDYASLSKSAITNFSGLVRLLSPIELHLHNPPERVHTHLERAFPTDFQVRRYAYPALSRETLLEFRDGFAGRLTGQEHVRDEMLAAMYPLVREERLKPVVVMFYGPSGVGKTETAKFVSELVGGMLMRRQFSMFHSENFASYLFGASHAEDSFAHDLLDRDSSVILIDELDKAEPVFHSALYEFFDDGVFVDRNYRVDVGRALIICTSNYASEDDVQSALGDALFSRFDAMIEFTALNRQQISQVVTSLVDERLEALSPAERELLDEDDIRKRLSRLANYRGNIRKVQKTVDGAISLALVNTWLDTDEEVDA